jgi:hypothetical protein
MLGRSAADPTSSSRDAPEDSWYVPDAEFSNPEQPARKRRNTDRHARRTPKGVLLLALKGLSTLLIVTKLLLSTWPTVLPCQAMLTPEPWRKLRGS